MMEFEIKARVRQIEFIGRQPLERIEKWIAPWLEKEIQGDAWESKQEKEERRDYIVPYLIRRKLTINEGEY
jgi:hypothetical protein